MPKWIVAILAGSLSFVAPAAAAQSFLSLQRYTPDEGLSQNAVTAIAHDDLGLMWIGTQEGLNRFDGHQFKILRAPAGDTTGLVSSGIETVVPDSSSRLWVGTNDAGLEVIDLRSKQRIRLGVADGLAHPTVRTILLDPAGGAWLGTASGVEYVGADLASVRRIGVAEPVVSMAFTDDGRALALDAECRLWRLEKTRIHAVPVRLPETASCVQMHAAGNELWLATTADGIHRITADGKAIDHRPATWLRPEPVELSALMQRRNGQWLLGYADGRVLQAPADWQLAPALIAFDQQIDSAVTQFHEHPSGVLWIGSATSGLFRARALSSAIRRDLIDQAAISAWPSRSVRSIQRDGQTLLVGTDAGLQIRDDRTGKWRTLDAIGATSVRVLSPSAQGGWWLGTHRGLWHLATDGKARQIPGLPDPRVTDLLVEHDEEGEQVWIATRGGLARLRNGSIKEDDLLPALQGQFLTSLMRDTRGRLWIGCNERGVFRLDPNGGNRQLDSASTGLPNDSIWSLHESDDAIWLGSFGGGLLRLDPDTDAVEAITEDDGLSNNVVYRIQSDASGRLWLTTNKGLSVLDPASGVVQTINRSDGLNNREYNSGASFVDADGLFYLGGTDGLDIIDPAQLSPISPKATPMITGLRVLGQQSPAVLVPLEPDMDVVYANKVTLGHRERVLQLDVVATDFTAPDAARLRYRIKGVHDDWIQPQGSQTSLILSYLPPGTYPLEVQAAGRDGRFAASRVLMLDMQPPPWRHPLAYAAYTLLALTFAGSLLGRHRTRTAEKQAQITRLNQTVAERTAALKQANHLLLRTNEQLELATRIDPLTQVSNRRDLQEWLDRELPMVLNEMHQPGRRENCMLLYMIDIDDFKRINDSFGHQAGDEVLVEVARRLRAICRERDLLVRWGGEEFLLLVRDAHLDDAPQVAERIRASVADAPMTLAGNVHTVPVTCSIGVAPWPLSPLWPSLGDWEQSVSLADMALYAAKSAGKNAWVGVVPGPDAGRPSLQSLLAGAVPEELPPGSVQVLHSTAAPPRFKRA